MWLVTDYPLWFALIVVWLVAGIVIAFHSLRSGNHGGHF